MPSNIENLVAAKASLIAELAEVAANPKPDYSFDGQSFSWAAYQDKLAERIEKINRLILQEQPYVHRSQVL